MIDFINVYTVYVATVLHVLPYAYTTVPVLTVLVPEQQADCTSGTEENI